MKKFKGAFLLALAILVAFAITATTSQVIASAFDVNPAKVFVPLFAASFFVKYPSGIAAMAIQREIWTKDIIDNLFKNNEFAEIAFNADQYVLNGKVVHIPVAGAPSTVTKNQDTFPVTAVKRTDSDVLYAIDTYYSTPRHIEKIEQYELSYDKRQSALGEDQAFLIQSAMDGLLYRWAWKKSAAESGNTPANVVLTVGSPTTSDLLSGATGSRNTLTAAAFSTIKKQMDIANIPAEGRVAVLNAYHYNQFLDSLSDTARTNFYRLADMSKGIIGEYLGFKFYMRSSVLRFRKVSGTWTPIDEQDSAFSGSTKTGDSSASIVYQRNCVERGKGNVDIFDNQNRAEYYGDIYSMELRLGGRQRRSAGVFCIVDDIPA